MRPADRPGRQDRCRSRAAEAVAALRNLTTLLPTALLCGCSHGLSVAPLAGPNPVGAVYVLPMTQWELIMTWRLADCNGAPKVALKVDATSSLIEDGSQAYVIDPASLQTLTSIGTFSAKWQDGSRALLSVNATAEDHTAAVVANVVTAVAKLAAATSSRAADNQGNQQPPPPCAPGLAETIALAAQQKGALDVINDQVAALTAEITRLTTKVTTMGASLDEETKRKLAAEIDRLADLKVRQTALADRLSGTVAKITLVRKVRWPEAATEAQGGPFAIDQTVLTRWFTDSSVSVPQVVVSVERTGTFGQVPIGGKLASGNVPGDGIRYRIPAQGRLLACTAATPPCDANNAAIILTTAQGPVAQLGYVGRLQVKNRTFGSTSFSAEFTPEMALKSVGYEQKAAPAEGASAALSGTATTVAPLFDPTQRLKDETAYLKALKDRRDAAAALQPSANDDDAKAKAALDADTSLLTAEATNLQAQIALDQLEATLPSSQGREVDTAGR